MRCGSLVFCLLAAVACGGSQKSAESPDSYGGDEFGDAGKDFEPTVEDEGPPKAAEDEADEKESSNAKEEALPEPQFVDGGSVDQAINAVPQGLPRENMEEEEINKPLLDMSIYSPCKLSANQHFTIKFAIWQGKVVGLDLTTTPKNAKAEECLREVVSRVSWRDKAKSLNISTVMF